MAKKETNEEFVNPFVTGVTYEDFTKAIGSTPIKEYLNKDGISSEDIAWIEVEIENYKLNKKNK